MELYDVAIVGFGPTGMSSGLYSSRSNLKTVVIEYGLAGGQLQNTETIENYLGFTNIDASELANSMRSSAVQFGLEEKYGFVEKIAKVDGVFDLTILGRESKPLRAKTVIVATGTNYKKLGIKGEDRYPVSNCALCDAMFYKGQEVIVVGGGDSAFEEADYITNHADKVTILFYKEEKYLKAKSHLQERVQKNDKITLRCGVPALEVLGEGHKITGLLVNNEEGIEEIIPTDGVFVYIGNVPQSEMISKLGVTNENGFVTVDKNMMTSVDGLFVAGDLVDKKIRQVANAVGEGAIAGQSVYNYLVERGKL